ncbi:MAG: DinB family protein [Actinomycetota bacterium]|nr:DinB family protein [Actinomycetota bacterium]
MGEEKRTFVDENLSGARFERCWMTDIVIRGSGVSGMEIDDPWLLEDGGSLVVNGVDVAAPSFDRVLEVRAERLAMVREFLADLTDDQLQAASTNPWAPDHPCRVLDSLQTILNEEWEHLRYAVRDLDAQEGPSSS